MNSFQYPVFRIMGADEGVEKGLSDRLHPIAPEFVEWLEGCDDRRGLVFDLPVQKDRAGKIIGLIGAKAGVVVNNDGKTATAHDLRRSFGTRWARRLLPADLQRLMRHEDIKTTMKYYVHVDIEDLGDTLWKHRGDQTGDQANRSSNRDAKDRLINPFE